MSEKRIALNKIVEAMDLKNLTPRIDLATKYVSLPEINRPALQLSGFFEEFPSGRVQIIGNVERAYLKSLDPEKRKAAFEDYVSRGIPCIICSLGQVPEPELIEIAYAHEVPIFLTERSSSSLAAELIRWMNVQLAPMISIHGVLVDVFGEGVLIMGESGIGKSEAALELLKRGHRLVADDVVEVNRVSDVTLVGEAPDTLKYFIELRGIGVIDVKMLFGVESVEETKAIDLVIKLEEWDKDKVYDRLGMEEEYTELLGINVVCHSLPIRPGRNLAVIVETAAVNHRQKKMGYNAAEALYKKVQENLVKNKT